MSNPKRQPRDTQLRLQYRAIGAYWGLTLAVIGATMLIPLAAVVAWPEEIRHAAHFVIPAVVLIVGGTWIYFRWRPKETVLAIQDGGLIVVLSWAAACIVGTWPFLAVEKMPLMHAMFESVSGWTTTGLSVVDVTTAQHLTLLWRSTMQVVGGAGFAIIMLAALTGPAGTGLPTAEGRSEQLVPHVRESAKLVLFIYCSYLAVGTIAYWLAGMIPFDAVNHAFAAVSTGGFSTRPDSIGHWDSVVIEAVTLPLMFLGNLNFLTAYMLWRGRLRAVGRDGEVRMLSLLIPAVALLLLLLVTRQLYPTLGKSVRVAIFETVTCLTTTGFSTVSYSNWSAFGIFLLIAFMIMGGGTGSTAGGMKQYRVYLLAKSIQWEVRRALLPPSAVMENSIWHSGERDYVTDSRIRQTGAFVFLYLLTLAAGTAVLTAHGISLPDALFEFASAQGTVGLSVGVTSVDAPPLVLCTEIAGMFLGRLEFLIVFISMVKLTRDLPKLITAHRGKA
jgi:trk system potassium uptake protein TrkH